MTPRQRAIERLRRADSRLADAIGRPQTLAPDRDRATPLAELGEQLLGDGVPEDVMEAWAEGIAAIVEAQADSFPDTIYWDLDLMAAELLRGPAGKSAEQMRQLCNDIAGLQNQYGRHSVLAFRYLHDFTYGYDWAKWLKREPDADREIGPFDPRFIAYLKRRGAELVDLIANDDEKYPKLPNGKPRNPFGFSRDPEHEARLFADLAQRDLLPLHAWETDVEPAWAPPYAEWRVERADELGIPCKPVGGA